jgi:CO/xanthine dehydrogenase Mo-binding subunit
VDAIERVTGQAKYTNDIKLPGMLYARVLRSPHAHARILRIDASEALQLPGVQAVITQTPVQRCHQGDDEAAALYL